jgi:hypothetical protein
MQSVLEYLLTPYRVVLHKGGKGCYDGPDISSDAGDIECIQNVGAVHFSKMTTWKTKKDVVGYIKVYLREIGCKEERDNAVSMATGWTRERSWFESR